MNRKYIGLGIIFLILVTIILCIVLIPSASKESHKVVIGNEEPVATTFTPVSTTPLPSVTPTCPDGAEKLTLTKVRVNAEDLHNALSTSCAGITALELLDVDITGLTKLREGNFVPLEKVALPNLRRFTFDRFLFPETYTMPSVKRKYIEHLTEKTFQDDLLFLKTKENGVGWNLQNLSTALDLDFIQIRINGFLILTLDRTTGLVEFKKLKPLENKILRSVRNDPSFALRNLTGQQSRLDVDEVLPKVSTLNGLHLYYSSLFSTSDTTQNLHTFIPKCTGLTELHLHLFDPPFMALDITDLIGLTQLKKFSFQYGSSRNDAVLLTQSTAQLTLPAVTYIYISMEWGQVDPKLVEAIPTLFPKLDTIIFDSYRTADHNRVLHQLLKMPSLLSITFYSYDLIPKRDNKNGDSDSEAKDAETAKTFLRHAGITPGLHDFVLTRTTANERWRGRDIRYFEKEGYARLSDD